jgi:hypothetical protein
MRGDYLPEENIMRLATANNNNSIIVKKSGATFYGRVVPQSEIDAIRDRLKKPPVKDGDPTDVDTKEFMLAMFDAAVERWEGLTDFDDNEVTHAKGKVREIEEFNPGFANDVLIEIHTKAVKIRKREEEAKEAERKN